MIRLCYCREIQELLEKAHKEVVERIRLVQKSIKNPETEYAEYNIDTGEVIYRKKIKTGKTNNKRVVVIKFDRNGGLSNAVISSNNGK